jgi:hypothetical protein
MIKTLLKYASYLVASLILVGVSGVLVTQRISGGPFDLGFMWNRFKGQQRLILNLICVFKHWHRDAVEDGRALIRHDGRVYKTNFVKVEDPELDAVLRAKLEDLAREWIAPAELGPPPAEAPNDVWFFRMDPRV